MKLICNNCNKVVDNEEYSYIELDSECESCIFGRFEEAKQCKHCEEYFEEYDLINNNTCDSCFENLITLENCLEVGSESKEKIKLNSFLTDVFSCDDIENILIEEVKNKKMLADKMKSYADHDKDYFLENIKE